MHECFWEFRQIFKLLFFREKRLYRLCAHCRWEMYNFLDSDKREEAHILDSVMWPRLNLSSHIGGTALGQGHYSTYLLYILRLLIFIKIYLNGVKRDWRSHLRKPFTKISRLKHNINRYCGFRIHVLLCSLYLGPQL